MRHNEEINRSFTTNPKLQQMLELVDWNIKTVRTVIQIFKS